MSEEKKREVSYCDAERAFQDGTYKSASDDELRDFHRACITVSGPNTSAVDRVRRVGEIIWEELSARSAQREGANKIAVAEPSGVAGPLPVREVAATEAGGWGQKEIRDLVTNSVEESLTLEYKAAGALSRDSKPMIQITKDASAMANSAGGVLIYGIAEDQATRELRLDPVNRVSFPREWIEQVVAQIRPRVVGLKISSVEVGGVKDEVVYVLEIPQGTTAHQAADCKYYRRYNFQCVAMYDHEIRDVMGRTKHPHVVVGARLVVYPRPNSDNEHGAFVLSLANDSDVFARYVTAVVDTPLRVCGKLVRYKDATLSDGESGAAYRLTFSNHNGSPLFPRSTLQPVFQFRFIDRMVPEPESQVNDFRVLVFADSMPKEVGTFRPEDILKVMPSQKA